VSSFGLHIEELSKAGNDTGMMEAGSLVDIDGRNATREEMVLK
jgi:hypothetical protein